MIVVDTNVVSELMRAAPDAAVVAWVGSVPPDQIATTAVTVAEILYGIARLPDGRRRDELGRAAREVFGAFEDRIYLFDHRAAAAYAEIIDGRERSGTPVSGFDAQIAAICRTRGAPLATRNVRDFADTGVELIDPWRATAPRP